MRYLNDRTRSLASTHGFTLIELLVVVAIIAVLIAVLLPSLQRARKSAQSVTCMSNLKQSGMGCLMYADDFNGWQQSYGNYIRWFYNINNKTLTSKYFALSFGDEGKLDARKFTWCPSYLPSETFLTRWDLATYFSYGSPLFNGNDPLYSALNASGHERQDYVGGWNCYAKIQDMPDASNYIYLADSIELNLVAQSCYFTRNYNVLSGVAGIHIRHQGRANVWMTDGHAESIDPNRLKGCNVTFYVTEDGSTGFTN